MDVIMEAGADQRRHNIPTTNKVTLFIPQGNEHNKRMDRAEE